MEDNTVRQALANCDNNLEETISNFCRLSLNEPLKNDASTLFASSLLSKLSSTQTTEDAIQLATNEFTTSCKDSLTA